MSISYQRVWMAKFYRKRRFPPLNRVVTTVTAILRPWNRQRPVRRGIAEMESNRLYYSRRALQESMKAARALTPQAQAWHRQLAEDFSARAQVGSRMIEA